MMLEEKGDLWEMEADARCITTNGTVKRNGRAVMGRGVALQAKTKHPNLERLMGNFLVQNGNILGCIPAWLLFTFPVKHNWWEIADLELIRQSCLQLMWVLNESPELQRVLLPAPGCGNGGLFYQDVLPAIRPLLDDRVCVVSTDSAFVPYSYVEGGGK